MMQRITFMMIFPFSFPQFPHFSGKSKSQSKFNSVFWGGDPYNLSAMSLHRSKSTSWTDDPHAPFLKKSNPQKDRIDIKNRRSSLEAPQFKLPIPNVTSVNIEVLQTEIDKIQSRLKKSKKSYNNYNEIMGTKQVEKDMAAWKEEIRQDENLLAYYQAEIKRREQAESNSIDLKKMFAQFSINGNTQNNTQAKPSPTSPSSLLPDTEHNKSDMELD